MKVACAVLAAGASRRLGSPKQLLEVGGTTLLRRVIEAACATRCEQVAVVLGAPHPLISGALEGTRAVGLQNDDWAAGMSSSLHSAVRWATAHRADALLLSACDQPLLTVVQLEALVETFQRGGRSVASRYQGSLGVPALVEARLFERLLAIRGDRGAASVLRGEPDVVALDWEDGALDLDTPEDVARFRGQ